MGLNPEHACLVKIITSGDIKPFIEASISHKFFPTHEHRLVRDMVWDHYRDFQTVPDTEAIHRAYPRYAIDPDAYPQPVAYYMAQLQEDLKNKILMKSVQQISKRIAESESGANIGAEIEGIMRAGLVEAAHEITQGRDVDMFMSGDAIIERLMDGKENPGYLRGVTTSFDGLDRLTGGFCSEQLVTFIGTPKTGKSSLMLKMAMEARLHGTPVLLMTFEMSPEEQQERMVSLLSGVGLTTILNRTFDPLEEERIKKAIRLRATIPGFIVSADRSNAMTLTGVGAKIAQFQPKVLFVDGTYMMQDESGERQGSPQALTNITRGFKRMAQNLRIPIVLSTQASLSRSGRGRNLDVDSVAYSSSFAQDSDILLGVEATEHVPTMSKVKTLAQRSGPTGVVYMEFDWSAGLVQEVDVNTYNGTVAQATPPVSGVSPRI